MTTEMLQLAATSMIGSRHLSPEVSRRITFAVIGNHILLTFVLQKSTYVLIYEAAAKSINLDNRCLHDMIEAKLG